MNLYLILIEQLNSLIKPLYQIIIYVSKKIKILNKIKTIIKNKVSIKIKQINMKNINSQVHQLEYLIRKIEHQQN